MITALKKTPKFDREQRVAFLGGSGVVKNLYPEAGTWSYLIEMEMGPEPDMGRIGSETRIVLLEPDILT